MFHWVPGMAASGDAIARMRSQFKKPRHTMGEAWFMGDKRKMYDELMSQPTSEFPCDYFQHLLYEVSSGKTSFGDELANGEWKPWFQYLLPDLILRAHEEYAFSYLLESVVITFATYFEHDPDAEYQGFRSDAINSLGIALMSPALWQGQPHVRAADKWVPLFLVDDYQSRVDKLIGYRDVEDAFASAMFFCAKYLGPADMASWVNSIISIENSHWRASILNWLLGAQDFLAGGLATSLEASKPQIRWGNSFLLEGCQQPLIPAENGKALREQFIKILTKDLLDDWEAQLKNEEQLIIEPRDNQIASLDYMFSCIRDVTLGV